MKKLSHSLASEIRTLREKHNLTLQELSHKYDVCVSSIWQILRNHTFYDNKYAPREKVPFATEFGIDMRKQGFTVSEIREAEMEHSRRKKPLSLSQIAKKLREAMATHDNPKRTKKRGK